MPLGAAAIAVLLFGTLALTASTGFFTIDEFIVFAGVEAVASHGSLYVANGLPGLVSHQLQLWILVAGENGLVPQYPPGSALVGAPLLSVFGLRGLLLSNVLAALASTFVLYHLVKRHFGGWIEGLVACGLFLFASFALEYAVGVWPHAWGILTVLVASKLSLDLIHDEQGNSLWRAAAIGAALGIGLLFRTDTVLAIAAIGAALFFFLQKPVRPLVAMAVGAAPFVLLLSILNFAKFGTFNPLTYGQSGGGTSITSHLALLVVLPVLVAGGFAVKHLWKSGANRRRMLVGGGLVLTVGLLVTHGFVLRWLHGFWALVVDATQVADSRAGIERFPDGTVSFWGLWKKALGQSMPWIALAIPALFSPRYLTAKTRWMVAILMLVWSMPFLPKDWHGGMGSNMRYFLPLVPFLCALAARTIVAAWQGVGRAWMWAVLGWLAGYYIYDFWEKWHATGWPGLHQILPGYFLLATTVCALAYIWRPAWQTTARALLIAGCASMTVAAQLALADYNAAQRSRQVAAELSERHLALPSRTLAFVPGRYLVGWAFQPEQVVALPNAESGKFDTDLIDAALKQDYRVFIWPRYVNAKLAEDPRYILGQSEIGREGDKLLELRLR